MIFQARKPQLGNVAAIIGMITQGIGAAAQGIGTAVGAGKQAKAAATTAQAQVYITQARAAQQKQLATYAVAGAVILAGAYVLTKG